MPAANRVAKPASIDSIRASHSSTMRLSSQAASASRPTTPDNSANRSESGEEGGSDDTRAVIAG